MPLKLMYITNRPEITLIAEPSGVNRLFVDMEYIGTADRQGGQDLVKNHHTVEDVRAMKYPCTSCQTKRPFSIFAVLPSLFRTSSMKDHE